MHQLKVQQKSLGEILLKKAKYYEKNLLQEVREKKI